MNTPPPFGPSVPQRGQLQNPLDLESEGALKLSLENVMKDVIVRRNRIQTVLLSGETMFNVQSSYMVMTAQAAVTIAKIGGGREGMILTLQFGDGNITITDDATGNADTVNLTAPFTSTANDVLQLLYDGLSWREVARSNVLGIGENGSVQLDPALSADGKYSGITETGTAGATLAFGDLCYLDPTDSRWELTDANAAAAADGDARGKLGICVQAAAADGSATTMLLWGKVRADAVFPTMTINNPQYVSETAGDITGTQPTTTDVVIRVVGFANTADELYFFPSSDYITHT